MTQPDGVRRGDVWFAWVNGQQFGPYATQAEAWRWYDRKKGDPGTPAEARTEYHFCKTANGE